MIYPVQDPKIINGQCLNISQYFGENVQIYGGKGHPGLDFAYLNPLGLPAGVSSYGKPVLSICDGVVTNVIWNSEHSLSGNGVIIQTDKYEIVYWHFSNIYVKEGQLVRMGDILGEMGNSGFVFPVPNLNNNDPNDDCWGTHCHLEMKEHINGIIQNVNNGFGGAIDPLQFLTQNTMLLLYGNSTTEEQYLKDEDGVLHRIANKETLLKLDEARIINKDSVAWMSPAQFTAYTIGHVILLYNDD